MKPYLLLTPGPLTTSTTVKEAMMTDWCTWDEDYNLGIVEELRKETRIPRHSKDGRLYLGSSARQRYLLRGSCAGRNHHSQR